MLEAESAISIQGKYIPGVGASGGARPSPYDRRGRGARGMRGAGGVGRARGGNIKGLMGVCTCNVTVRDVLVLVVLVLVLKVTVLVLEGTVLDST